MENATIEDVIRWLANDALISGALGSTEPPSRYEARLAWRRQMHERLGALRKRAGAEARAQRTLGETLAANAVTNAFGGETR